VRVRWCVCVCVCSCGGVGWLDYVGYYPSQLVHYFSYAHRPFPLAPSPPLSRIAHARTLRRGRYTVPQTPKNMGGLLYWFIGSENFQTGVRDTHTHTHTTHNTRTRKNNAHYLAT
jgi:hypothetical protein